MYTLIDELIDELIDDCYVVVKVDISILVLVIEGMIDEDGASPMHHSMGYVITMA